jgi:hypothetical protein
MPAKSPKSREARFEDYAQIFALTAKFQLQTESYAGWTHLWSNNPAYREREGKFPIGWVLENGDGAICGYLGNIPLHYEFEGKRLLAATTRAWVVDSAYRTYSPLLLGTYFKQPDVDLFMNTTVNAQAAPAYAIFEGVRVPVGAWDRTLFWITNAQGFTESVLRKKGLAIAKSLSYPLSVGVMLREKLRRGFRQSNVTVRECSYFDERFDNFWVALRKKKSNLLLAVRSREALDWHFKFALQQNAAWIYMVEKDSEPVSYAVFLRQDNPEAGLTRVRLADFQCLEPGNETAFLNAFLGAAIERCRQESIHMLELIGFTPQLERELERTSPHRRPLPNWIYFYKAGNPLLADKLKNPAVWEASLFDGDSSL